MEPTESRYAHLLQPIRELTKNWEIDVASELNDYLEELDGMCITFDDGKTKVNFAEAALLIQGSTCIYSKKVEMLHNLVYQTLEYINDRNKKRSKQASASADEGGSGAEYDGDEDEDGFCPIDAVASEKSQKADSNTFVSVAPLPPESLIPPEAHEKHKLPLISVKGEILCSLKDFRINIFIPGDDDMIVLTLGSTASRLSVNKIQPFQTSLHQPQDAAVSALIGPLDDDVMDDAAGFLPIEEHMEQDPPEHRERQQVQSEGRMIRERRQVGEDKLREETPIATVDVWALHDPYSLIGEDTPFKAGKCYKVPDGLDDGGKRKRKKAPPLPDFQSWFNGIFEPPEPKFKTGPSFTDLNYIYLSTVKDRVKTRRRINRTKGRFISDEDLRQTFLEPEEPIAHHDMMGGDDDHSDNEADGGFPDDIPAEFGGGDIIPESQRDDLSYEDLVTLRVDQLMVDCRDYTQETALSRRVKDWEDKLRPELLSQELRPPLDIQDYSERIVTSLHRVGQRRSFSSIVSGLDNFEACKYLMASLQLANDSTVEIDSVVGVEESVDTMGLTLLSTVRATDRFKTMTASQSNV